MSKTIKKQLLLITILFISTVSFGQKSEIKEATKALAKNDFSGVLTTLTKVEGMNLDDKTKAKFLFLKSKALNGSGKVMAAANTINELVAFEKKTGKAKYTKEVQPMLQTLVANLRDKGIKEYDAKKFNLAKNTLAQVEELNPLDTAFLNYAALAAYQDKDLDLALKHFLKLDKLGYTGIATIYSALNKETKQRENFTDANHMKLMMKSKLYSDPKTDVLKSKRGNIIKNIATIYLDEGNNEKALEAISNARKEAPNDINIILTEADIAYKMKDNNKFITLMQEAVIQQPDNEIIYNNIGVVSRVEGKIEEAKEAFKKAIELKPDYKEAIINLADTELSRDEKIVEKMNENLNDFDKYDEFKAQQLALYRDVLPLFEKANSISDANYSKSNEKSFLRTYMSILEQLEMYDKMKEVKAKYDTL